LFLTGGYFMKKIVLLLCILCISGQSSGQVGQMNIQLKDGSQGSIQIEAISRMDFTRDRTSALLIQKNDGTLEEYKVFQFDKITFAEMPTSVDKKIRQVNKPEKFTLLHNYPNPFNPSTTIGFVLFAPGHVQVQIFNIKGQKIRTLASGHYQTGFHHVIWDGTNDKHQLVSNGIYFYHVKFNDTIQIKKLSFIK
jgi:hypothetical protein